MLAATAGTASAAKKCNIVGNFTDSLGSSGTFTSEKKGTVSNGLICSAPYALTVTTLTLATIDIKGKSKDKSCGALTGSFAFQNGGCDSATGTVTIVGFGTANDTITKSTAAARQAPENAALIGKLK
jgi:hypothetical protein